MRDSHSASKHRRSAFTLIELLACIVIISLLASLVFVLVARSLDKARSARSLSNMRQVGLAVHLFSQDNKRALPCGWNAISKKSWTQQLEGYLGEPTHLICPLMLARDGNSNQRTSYAMNNNLGDRPNKEAWEGISLLSQAVAPESTAVLFNSFYEPGTTTWKFSATGSLAFNEVKPADGIHVHVLFLDNSVKPIPKDDDRLPGGTLPSGRSRQHFWLGK